MNYNISVVLLDLDGLLLDTERVQLEVGPDVVARFGFSLPPEFLERLVGVTRMDAARIIGRVPPGGEIWTADCGSGVSQEADDDFVMADG
ncbi:hypothetical protein [Primorskyibacter flagellatus]|uniref:Haloacid dehalogenase-like hydrolase n=1 Tax=Primorskyibacter flagellatus TaxID=1387277 RepID=A0A1W2E9K6_9RHOB|nr:hypothetical protein [Primorskyibacter flagellatus]SMD06421.1 hypothetical protein SAMN06295998_1257 [Primorskyibacter flagellatus]